MVNRGKTGELEGMSYSMQAQVDPGEIRYSYNVSGRATNLVGTVRFRVDIFGIQNFFDETASSVISSMSEQSGVPEPILRDWLSTNAPSELTNTSGLRESHGVSSTGTISVSEEGNFGYETPSIPVPQGSSVSEFIPEDIEPTMTLTLSAHRPVIDAKVSEESLEINMPATSFTEQTDIEFSCSDEYADIENRIDSIKTSVEDIRQNAIGTNEQLSSIRDQMDSEELSMNNPLSTVGSFRDIPEDTIQNWRNNIQNADLVVSRIESKLEEINTLRSDIQQIESGQCVEQFTTELNNEIDIDLLEQRRNSLNSLISELPSPSQLERVLEELDVEPPEPPERPSLGCEDVPEDIRQSMSEAHQNALDSIGGRETSGDSIRDALEKVQEEKQAYSNWWQNRTDSNPCESLSELRDLNRVEERLNNTLEDRDGRGGDQPIGGGGQPIDEVDLPCSDRFEQVDTQLSNYEEMTRTATTDITKDELESLSELEREIADLIENNVDDRDCLIDFRRRLRSAGRNIDRVVSPIRIEEGDISQSQQTRQEILENLSNLSSNLSQIEVPEEGDEEEATILPIENPEEN